MHLLVILLQQLLGLLPNKQQAQPEPVRVRTAQPNSRPAASRGDGTPEQQAFQSSAGLNRQGTEFLRTGSTVFCKSRVSARINRAVPRAGGGLGRSDAPSVDGTLPAARSHSSAAPLSPKSAGFSPDYPT
jgi:hypothetical protein